MPGIDVRMMSYGERVPAQVSRPQCILVDFMKMLVTVMMRNMMQMMMTAMITKR